jgi:hypothetical protein
MYMNIQIKVSLDQFVSKFFISVISYSSRKSVYISMWTYWYIYTRSSYVHELPETNWNIWASWYECGYIYLHRHIFSCTVIYIYQYKLTKLCIKLSYVHIYTYIYMYKYIYIHTCIHIHMCIYIDIYTYICIHTCAHLLNVVTSSVLNFDTSFSNCIKVSGNLE